MFHKIVGKHYLFTAAILIGCLQSAISVAVEPDVNGKNLFILSGQSNMVGMKPEVSFTPAVTNAFGADKVIVVKDAHGGQSIRSWCKTNHEFPPPTTGH